MRRFLSTPRIPVRQDSITLTGFMIMVVLAIVMAAAWVPGPLQADEGMWLLNELKNCPVDSWHARGLQLDIKDIYDPDESPCSFRCPATNQLGRVEPDGRRLHRPDQS